MVEVIQLAAHENMTVKECLEYCRLEQEGYKHVLVLVIDQDDDLIVRSSHMTRKDALWILMDAVDHARGLS